MPLVLSIDFIYPILFAVVAEGVGSVDLVDELALGTGVGSIFTVLFFKKKKMKTPITASARMMRIGAKPFCFTN